MLTLALTLSLAAPVPKTAPFPLRTDPLPAEYKPADLDDAALPRSQKGTVSLLAWETVEDDRPHSVTRALVVKAFEKADEKGNKFALCLLYRKPGDTEWQHRFIDPPPVRPGEKMPEASEAFWFGTQRYAKPPTDKQLAAFLKDVDWTPKLGAEVAHFSDGKRTITTKLAGGGCDPTAWKTAFDRDPPTELFPELKLKQEEK